MYTETPVTVTPVTVELTIGAIPVLKPIKRRKPKNPKVDGLTVKQKKFVKAIIQTRGNQRAAYSMAYGLSNQGAAVSAHKLIQKPHIQNAITKELDKHGLTRDYFLNKLKDLAEAKDKDGHSDYRIQLDTTKIGMEMHGMMKKEQEAPAVSINYNIDSDKLSGVLDKLSMVTRKLELVGLPKGTVEDATVIEQDEVNQEADDAS